MEAIFNRIAQQMELSSYAVIENFLPEEHALTLYQEIKILTDAEELRIAAIGRGAFADVVEDIRKDEIKWIDQPEASKDVIAYLALIKSLGVYLSQYYRVSIKRYEGHWAHYPSGAFYKKHIDQFQQTNNRVFSVISYLNPQWEIEDGGELVIYLENGEVIKIAPKLGSLVCFRSDVLFHEVLPTQKSRYSITGWYRKDEILPIGIG